MWVVFCGAEDVAQFDKREDAEIHAENLNDAYRTSSYRLEFLENWEEE